MLGCGCFHCLLGVGMSGLCGCCSVYVIVPVGYGCLGVVYLDVDVVVLVCVCAWEILVCVRVCVCVCVCVLGVGACVLNAWVWDVAVLLGCWYVWIVLDVVVLLGCVHERFGGLVPVCQCVCVGVCVCWCVCACVLNAWVWDAWCYAWVWYVWIVLVCWVV